MSLFICRNVSTHRRCTTGCTWRFMSSLFWFFISSLSTSALEEDLLQGVVTFFYLNHIFRWNAYHILAKWGPDSSFVIEANTKSRWPKSSRSQIVKLMDRGWVTRPRVKYQVKCQVEYRILGELLRLKVKFLFVSDNNWLWPILWCHSTIR